MAIYSILIIIIIIIFHCMKFIFSFSIIFSFCFLFKGIEFHSLVSKFWKKWWMPFYILDSWRHFPAQELLSRSCIGGAFGYHRVDSAEDTFYFRLTQAPGYLGMIARTGDLILYLNLKCHMSHSVSFFFYLSLSMHDLLMHATAPEYSWILHHQNIDTMSYIEGKSLFSFFNFLKKHWHQN